MLVAMVASESIDALGEWKKSMSVSLISDENEVLDDGIGRL